METIIYKISDDKSENDRILTHAADVIKSGGLVAFPTETVYGLGANAYDASAAVRIFEAKGRPGDNPLIVHILNPEDAEKIAYVPQIYYDIAANFMPGPLTVILKKRETVPDEVTAGLDSVAVRVPAHVTARRLIEFAGVPIAAPSANRSGKPSPTCAMHVIDDMDGRIDIILSGGDCDLGLESTVIKISGDDGVAAAAILRPGAVTAEMIRAACGIDVVVEKSVMRELQKDEIPLSPGMKHKHYAPTAPLTLVDGSNDKVIEYFIQKMKENESCAVICYEEEADKLRSCAGANKERIVVLAKRDDIQGQSKRLFSALREADDIGGEASSEMYAHLPSSGDISLALYNRMIRAAAHTIISLECLNG